MMKSTTTEWSCQICTRATRARYKAALGSTDHLAHPHHMSFIILQPIVEPKIGDTLK